ncbi:DUF6049 family protein [Arcanobacterium phocae]|uniref:DUF6049 family protein n=1 Tax=Arcanobacterium phocae TaxID=131112 RepID=UPI001C0EAB74|nr:DUF6049 family protein [Arcanobacterium phocae]
MKKGILTAVLTALSLATTPVASWASTPHAPLTVTADAAPSIAITSVGEATLAPEKDLTLEVTITNPTSRPLSISALNLRAQVWPASNMSQITAWMNGDLFGYQLRRVKADLDIPAGQSTVQKITVPRKDINWKNTAQFWGPRGIAVDAVVSQDLVLTDYSYLVVIPDSEIPQSNITTVVPVVDDTLVTPQTPYELVQAALNLPDTTNKPADADKLSGWDIPGVTLLADPALTRPATLKNVEYHALPANDADLAALVHANATDRLHQFITSDNDVYVPAGNTDIATLRAVRAAGMTSAIISDSQIPQTGPVTYTEHAHTTIDIDGTPMTVLTANSALSHAVTGTLTDGDTTLALDQLDRRQVSLAMSAVLYRQQPSNQRDVVVVADRATAAQTDTEAIRETLTSLAQAPWNHASSINQILRTPEEHYEAEALPETVTNPGEFGAQQLAVFDKATAHARQVKSLFEESSAVDQLFKAHSDAFFSTHWRTHPDQRDSFVARLGNIDKAALKVETSSTINLISESSALPIHVSNAYDYPVTITVKLDVPDTRLHALNPTTTTIPAKGTESVLLPVEAWGSGDLDVKVLLTSDDGTPVGNPATVPVRVRANWENMGTIVIAGSIGVLFLIGVFKSIRNGRRSKPVDAQVAIRALHQRARTATSSPDSDQKLSEDSE